MLGIYGCGSGGGSSDGPEPDPASQSNVIIIGAGIAGLSAARALEKKGIEVMIVEARDRIGGRVWTDHSIPGLALDMGASWIHGVNNNPISRIASDAELPTRTTDYGNIRLYDANGKPDPMPEVATDQFVESLSFELKSLGASSENSSVQDAVNIVVGEGGEGSLSSAQVDYLVNTRVEHEFAAEAMDLSVMAVEEGEGFSGDDAVFPDGYSGVTEYLARGIDIRLSKVVTSIDYSGDVTTITTIEGEQFTAGRVMVTVPLGVLKKGNIKFIPELPTEKLEAIQALGMGVLNKVFLRFPSAFWDEDADLIGFVAQSEKGRWAEWLNISRYVNEPLLLAFNAGTYGREIESLSDDEIVFAGMNVLRNIYGQGIPEPTAFKISRWGGDPYAYGSYSYLKVGAETKMREVLAEPIAGKLYFAGEATHQKAPATVHGAYLSGIREADRIN